MTEVYEEKPMRQAVDAPIQEKTDLKRTYAGCAVPSSRRPSSRAKPGRALSSTRATTSSPASSRVPPRGSTISPWRRDSRDRAVGRQGYAGHGGVSTKCVSYQTGALVPAGPSAVSDQTSVSAKNASIRSRKPSRTRRKTCSRWISSPSARAGSSNPQCTRTPLPGKTGQASAALSQTVMT